MAGNETKLFDHEGRLAVIETNLKTNTTATEKILAILQDGNGVVTKTALNSQSIKRLWWLVGPMVLIIVGAGLRSLIK